MGSVVFKSEIVYGIRTLFTGTWHVSARDACQALGYKSASGVVEKMASCQKVRVGDAGGSRELLVIGEDDFKALAERKYKTDVYFGWRDAKDAAILSSELDCNSLLVAHVPTAVMLAASQTADPAEKYGVSRFYEANQAAESAELAAIATVSEPPKPRILGSDIFGLLGDIRIVDRAGNDWYVAKDVAEALGYVNTTKAILDHCKGGTEMVLPSPGGPQSTKIISAGDVFALVNNSQLAGVKPFKDWINHKVLVSIDKTGEYKLPAPASSGSALVTPDFLRQLAQQMEDLTREKDAAVSQLEYAGKRLLAAETQVAELTPQAAYGKLMSSVPDSCTVDSLARHLSAHHFTPMTQTTLYQWLRYYEYVCKAPTKEKWNKPTEWALREKLLTSVAEPYKRGSEDSIGFVTYVMYKGVYSIVEKLVELYGIPSEAQPAIVDVHEEMSKANLWAAKTHVKTGLLSQIGKFIGFKQGELAL